MIDFKIIVTDKAIAHGLSVGIKVYKDKLGFPDKWQIGGSSELQADVYGFIAETIVCESFKQPIPELTKGKLDQFDLLIGEKRVDVKKISYSRASRKSKITLNKKQFLRKKDLIDIFLFCTFQGAFAQREIIVEENGKNRRHKIYLPMAGVSTLWIIGWIATEDVERKSKLYVWKDKDGNPRDEAFQLYEKNLKPIEELVQ